MDIEDEKDEYQTEESAESLADQVLAMNSREEMRVRLIQIFSHLKELKAELDRWEQGTEEDFVIDKGDANDDSVVEITENVRFPTIRSETPCPPTKRRPSRRAVAETAALTVVALT